MTCVVHNHFFRDRPLVARINTRLMRLLDEHPNNPHLTKLVVIVTSHATSCIMRYLGSLETYDDLALEPIVFTALNILRSSGSDASAVSHALTIVLIVAQYAAEKCRPIPGLVTLLVALTRSKRMLTRGLATGSLGFLIDTELSKVIKDYWDPEGELDSEEDGNPDCSIDSHYVRTNEMMHVPLPADISRDNPELPEHITRILGSSNYSDLEYAIETRCDHEFRDFFHKQSSVDVQKNMADSDRRALGRMLAKFVLTIGYPSPEFRASFAQEDRNVHLIDMGQCIESLRQCPDGKADLDAADVLELRIYTWHPCACGHNGERELAQCALKRSPDLAYAHLFDAAACAPATAGQSAARRGLECAGVSRWLRGELLIRRMLHTYSLVRGVFWKGREFPEGGRVYDFAGALIVSGLRDADAFIAEAPPDAFLLPIALEYKLIFMLLLQGDAIDPQLVKVRACPMSTSLCP